MRNVKQAAAKAAKAAEKAAKAAKAVEVAEKAAGAIEGAAEAAEKAAEAVRNAPKLSKNGGYFPEEYNDYVDEMYADQVREYESKPDEWQFDGFYWKPIGNNPLAKRGK